MSDPWADIGTGAGVKIEPAKKKPKPQQTPKPIDDPWADIGDGATVRTAKEIQVNQTMRQSGPMLQGLPVAPIEGASSPMSSVPPEMRNPYNNNPETGMTAEGSMGAVVRGAGPQTVLAAIPGYGPALSGIYTGTVAVMDPLTELLNTVLPDDLKSMPPSQGIQHLLTKLGVANPETAAERILQAGASGLSASQGAVNLGRTMAGGPMQAPSMTTRVGEALATQPASQLAGGAGGAAAAQMASEAGGDPMAQFGAGLAGSLLGATAASRLKVGAPAPERPVTPQEQMVQDARAVGGKLMTSDVFPPQGGAGKLTQLLSEKNPFFGTGPMRAEQQRDRVDAIRDILNSYGADDVAVASDAVMADLAAKRGADLGKYTQMKNVVIDKLSQPTAGLSDARGAARTAPIVPVSNATSAIDAQIAKLKGLKTKEVEPVIAKLEDWKQAIKNQPLSNVEALRRQFGESFKSPDLASVSDLGQKSVNAIYPAIRKDMETFIRANGTPQDLSDWMVGNKQLADMAGELKNDTLASVLKRGDATPEVVQKLLFSAKPSDVQTLYRNLTPEGQANARAAVLAKAAQNSFTAGTDVVSPEKFVTQVQKLGGPIGVFFSGDDKAQLDGLVRYLNSTRRATQAGINPPTGIQTLIPQIGLGSAGFMSGTLGGGASGGLMGVLSAVAGATTLGGISRTFESAPVRDLLIKLSKAPDGARGGLMKRINEAIRAEQSATDNQEAQ